MTDPAPVRIELDPALGYPEQAKVVLAALFPDQEHWGVKHYSNLSTIIQETVQEGWPVMDLMLRGQGMTDDNRLAVRHTLIVQWWNQTCFDLFGDHVSVVRKETKDAGA